MYLVVHEGIENNRKYAIAYCPDSEHVIDGRFIIKNEDGEKVLCTQKELFDLLDGFFSGRNAD